MNKRKTEKKIAYQDNTIAIEKSLPLPIIFYPGFYGTFFGFKKKNDDDISLCSCALEAIENYVTLHLENIIPQNVNPYKMYILSSSDFPVALIEGLIANNIPNDEKIINYLKFEDKICHECNRTVPEYRWCHEMYGGVFKQNFGWYINQQAYEFGIEGIHILSDKCPQEILDLIKLDPLKTREKFTKLMQQNKFTEANELDKKLQKQERKIWKIIENEVRIKFGHKKIGEAWTSETILYYITKKLYPNFTIKRHYKPDFLEGLELDIYIEEIKTAIEYQGIQHYKPVKYWGGQSALKNLKERDKKKKNICRELNITVFPQVKNAKNLI